MRRVVARMTAAMCALVVVHGVSIGREANTGSVSQFGIELVSFHYKEPGAMREDGTLYGMYHDYSNYHSNWLYRITTSLSGGTLFYDGMLMDGTPFETDTQDVIFNTRFLAGPVHAVVEDDAEIIPFLGLGYRFLVDDLPPPYGYRREQHYLYMPVGVETLTVHGDWTLGVRVEYKVFLHGYNWSGGDSFTQDTGYGYGASFYVRYAGPEIAGVVLSIEPFYSYWDVEDSTISAGGYIEPANSTVAYGIRLLAEF